MIVGEFAIAKRANKDEMLTKCRRRVILDFVDYSNSRLDNDGNRRARYTEIVVTVPTVQLSYRL